MNRFFIISCLLFSSQVWGARISAIKEKKASVLDAEEVLAPGDEVRIVDEASEEVGRGVIKKRVGKKVLLVLQDGEMKKGQEVVIINPSRRKDRSPASRNRSSSRMSVAGYAGIYNSSIKPIPIAFGADLKYPMKLMDMPLVFRGGVTYWSGTTSGVSVSALDIAGGAGWQFNFGKKFSMETGGRIGYASLKFSASYYGTSSSVSVNGFSITPYVGGLYHLNDTLAFGAELRITGYFTNYGNAFGDTYLLGQVAYTF